MNFRSGIADDEVVYLTEIERFILLAIETKHIAAAEYLHYK